MHVPMLLGKRQDRLNSRIFPFKLEHWAAVHMTLFKGQINQNFDIFSFNPIYLLCVDLVSNKHILKFQVNWT